MIFIDLYMLLYLTVPPFLRREWYLDYLHAIFKPLQQLLDDFFEFFDRIEYDLCFNGQIIYLEHVLNDKFDPGEYPANRRIYIEDADTLQETFIFNDSEENEEIYVFNESEGEDGLYLFNESEIQADYDFIVYVPTGLVFNEPEFKATVNRYRLAPFRWKIEYV